MAARTKEEEEKKEIRKNYHVYDDDTVEALKQYFKVKDEEHDTLLRYLKDNKSPRPEQS